MSVQLNSSGCFGLCVEVLLELNFHKFILAPRTSSKVEVFSYSSKTEQYL